MDHFCISPPDSGLPVSLQWFIIDAADGISQSSAIFSKLSCSINRFPREQMIPRQGPPILKLHLPPFIYFLWIKKKYIVLFTLTCYNMWIHNCRRRVSYFKMCFFIEVRFYFYKFYIEVEGRQAAECSYTEAEGTFPERSYDVCSKVLMDKLLYIPCTPAWASIKHSRNLLICLDS